MERFKDLSNLLGIQGVINVIQIHIEKSKVQTSVIDHYSFKSKAYNM